MAVTFNCMIDQGTTWVQEIVVPGIDLTGATGTCQIRKYASADSVVVASPVVTFTVPASGTFELSLTATETAMIPVTVKTLSESTVYIYDVLMTNGGIVTKVASGSVSVYPAVTR